MQLEGYVRSVRLGIAASAPFVHLLGHLAEVAWCCRGWTWPRPQMEAAARELLLTRFLTGCGDVAFYKSGRSALRAVFRALAEIVETRDVLVPDYICNVVPRAALMEGFRCVAYRTDEHCRVDFMHVERLLRSHGVACIVLASIFGAQNTTPAEVQVVRTLSSDALIILDECQNLTPEMSVEPDSRTVVVFSFNRKTIPGAMGGGVAFRDNFLALRAPPLRSGDILLEIYIFLVLVNQVRERLTRSLRRRWHRAPYAFPNLEYTPEVLGIHYDFEVQRIARLSLCRALDGLRRFAEHQRVREMNCRRLRKFLSERQAGELDEIAACQPCPFVPIRLTDRSLLGRLPLKGPYALEGRPRESLRPESLAFRNEPFDELILGW